MKKIKQANLARFDNKLKMLLEETSEAAETGESKEPEEITKVVAICYLEDVG